MKKLVLSIAAICAAVSLNAQNYDLETALVAPVSGSTVPATATVNVNVDFINNGPTDILTGSTLWFSYVVNGTDIYSLDGVVDGASGVTLPAGFDFNSGDVISSAQIGGIVLDLSGLSDGDDVCIVFWGEGDDALEQTGDLQETDMTNNADCFSVSVSSASIKESTLETSVYPNPANDVLNVKSNEQIATITILSLDGKVVASSTSTSVNVTDLNSGLYIYNVVTVSGKESTAKFMKK